MDKGNDSIDKDNDSIDKGNDSIDKDNDSIDKDNDSIDKGNDVYNEFWKPFFKFVIISIIIILILNCVLVVLDNEMPDDGISASLDVTDTNDGVNMMIMQNNNIDKITILHESGSKKEIDVEIYPTVIDGLMIDLYNFDEGIGEYKVIAVLEDGSEVKYRTVTVT